MKASRSDASPHVAQRQSALRKLSLLVAVATYSCLSALAQGTISFQNFSQPTFFAPDYLNDGTTPLSGPQYMAELLAGPSADNLTAIASTSFFSGSSAGYFDGGTQIVPDVPGGATAFAQVGIWNTALGATFDLAKGSGLPNAWAQSPVFPVVTGKQDGGIPTLPGFLTGLTPLSLNGAVPEPSTLVLASLAAGLMLLCWR